MNKLWKLLPGAKREPKILVAFSNRQQDCDRLIRYLSRRATSADPTYPIYAYCLEMPREAQNCARLVVDPDPQQLYRQAQSDLSDVWVALSATSWNRVPRGTGMKLIPLTLLPFRGVVFNENGDFFPLKVFPITRHLIHRYRQWSNQTFADFKQWIEVNIVWSMRHTVAWLRRTGRDKVVWGMTVPLGRMAWFAERVSPLMRTLFDLLPKGAPQSIELASSNQSFVGITRIDYEDTAWQHKTVTEILQKSEADFVLFCPPSYAESFENLLPLFNDPLTFAVTPQSGFREWRPTMLALSPFRVLKPKEATRVEAPLAKVILVHRPKLMKLAMPKTMVLGAAWLSLFWRASAAGWRSYSVGGTGPVEQQIDYWLEEMLFVKDLYFDRGLRRMSPETPLLARGNVSFRPDLTRPYRGLPKVLVVAPYLPFPLSHGGAVRIYNLCRVLADRVDFIFIGFREVVDDVDYAELHRIFRRVYIVDRDEINSEPSFPKQVNHFETSSMRAMIADVAKEQEVDLVQIEYTEMAAYREAVPQRPAILVEHDITYTLHRQFNERDGDKASREEYERWLEFETGCLQKFDGVFVMSAQDKEEAVGAGANRQRTYVIPNGVDLERYRALPPRTDGETEIFNVGSFRHLPNLLGFEELRLRIMPLVWNKYPHAKLRVVAGPDYQQHWSNALGGATIPQLDSRITIHGFVSDLLPLYEAAHIVAVPLPLSAGTNIKVMEALACQRAVVATPVGAQGLGLNDGFDALIRGLGEDFAAAICELIENPLLRGDLARNGRVTAESRFSWDAIARDALNVYALLIGESRSDHAACNERRCGRAKKDQERDKRGRESCGISQARTACRKSCEGST